MIPARVRFSGLNFVIESHMLERHKFRQFGDNVHIKISKRPDPPVNKETDTPEDDTAVDTPGTKTRKTKNILDGGVKKY